MEQQNNFSMTLGSLFDGSGGPLGGVLAGIKHVLCTIKCREMGAVFYPFKMHITVDFTGIQSDICTYQN